MHKFLLIGKVVSTTIAFYFVFIGDPTFADQRSFHSPHFVEDLMSDSDGLLSEVRCNLDERCSATRPSLLLAASEKGSATLSRDKMQDLLRALDGGEPQMRRRAAKTLGLLGEAAEHALPELLVAADDQLWYVRADAIWAIGKVVTREQTVDAVDVLTAALDDPFEQVRWSAAWSLARIGPAAEAAVPALIESLKDPARKIRASAVSALKRVTSQNDYDVVIPALLRLTDDDDKLVQQRAATALRTLKSASDGLPRPVESVSE